LVDRGSGRHRGSFSTLFIVTANAWMNVATGVRERNESGLAEPLHRYRPGGAPEAIHMLLAH